MGKVIFTRGVLFFALVFFWSCSQAPKPTVESQEIVQQVVETVVYDTVLVPLQIRKIEPAKQVVLPGINSLINSGFDALRGKRVGLITNQTGVDTSLESTIDILFNSPNVDLRALFSPEHGIRGSEEAGKILESYIDSSTGLPVFSLHGKNRRMSPDMVEDIDIIVYDIQDIGCRSYTFISTMGLAMETCARTGKEFMVLDRPNPLGGLRIEGRGVDPEQISFVSQYSIPYIYGLTAGELATLLNEEGFLEDDLKVNLTVIPMIGWNREMTFRETGLSWIPTSPHIPNMDAPFYYAMSGILGELGVISEGVGYTAPFKYFGAPWIDPDLFASALNSSAEGVYFRPVVFKPYYGKYMGQYCGGVETIIRDEKNISLIDVQFLVLEKLAELYPEKNIFNLSEKARVNMFDKVVGTDSVRISFLKTGTLHGIQDILHRGVEEFRNLSSRYYLYD